MYDKFVNITSGIIFGAYSLIIITCCAVAEWLAFMIISEIWLKLIVMALIGFIGFKIFMAPYSNKKSTYVESHSHVNPDSKKGKKYAKNAEFYGKQASNNARDYMKHGDSKSLSLYKENIREAIRCTVDLIPTDQFYELQKEYQKQAKYTAKDLEFFDRKLAKCASGSFITSDIRIEEGRTTIEKRRQAELELIKQEIYLQLLK